MMRRLIVGFALVALPAQAAAQTLFTTRGLGAPIQPADARATSLGGNTVGLFGFNLSLDNPAESAGLLRRGASATVQPSWIDAEVGGVKEGLGGSRFPLLRVIYPVSPRLVASLAYGGYLDQTWAARFAGEEVLGSDTVATSDVVRSRGGIAQLRFGFSYELNERLAVGLHGGLYTGSLDRSVRRTFGDTTAYESYDNRLRWSYKAPQATIGARWDALDNVRVGAALTVAGKLQANPEEGAAIAREYDAPMKMSAGVSAMLTPLLMATAGVAREKFPGVASDVTGVPGSVGAATRETMQYGGGLEYTGMRSGARVFPLRLGYRMAELPYAGIGESAPKEWAFSAGSGFTLATDAGVPQALLDVSLERAGREGLESAAFTDGLRERFWRMSVSLSLFGR